jgi:hypothetical protein
MKALSLWQPHAEAIALGLKPFETRGWATEYRGPLAIHAAKKVFREQDYDWNWFRECKARLSVAGMPLWRLSYGKIVCIADLVECLPTEAVRDTATVAMNAGIKVNWLFWGDFQDRGEDGRLRFAFKLDNIRKIPEAQRPEIKGMQGFFEVPNEIGLWG